MSECNSHPHRQACALCIVFSLILHAHPNLAKLNTADQDDSIPGQPSPADALHDSHTLPPGDNALPPRDGVPGQQGGYRHIIPGLNPSPEEIKGMQLFLKKIFAKYGEGGVMTFEGFQKLMDNLDVGHVPTAANGDYLEGSITRHVQPHHHHDRHTTDYDDYEYVNQNGETSHEGESHHEPNSEKTNTGHEHDGHESHARPKSQNTATNDKGTRDHQSVDHEHALDDEHIATDGRQDPAEHPPRDHPTSATKFNHELATPPNLGGGSGKTSAAVPLEVTSRPKTDLTEGAQNNNSHTTEHHSEQSPGNLDPAQDQSARDKSQTQAKFRTRRLTSVKSPPGFHIDTPLFDIPPASPQGHNGRQGHSPSHRHHALRHRRQRQNSYFDQEKALPLREARDRLLLDELDELASSRFKRDIAESEHLPALGKQQVRSAGQQQPDRDEQCLSSSFLLNLHDLTPDRTITEADFLLLCPALIQQIDSRACTRPRPLQPLGLAETDHAHDDHDHAHGELGHAHGNHSDNHTEDVATAFHVSQVSGEVWGYAFLSVLIISLVGLLSVAVVPIMQKVFYNHLLQFLVGLAVGTLTGDALLHLIPHALGSAMGSHGEPKGHADGHGDETTHGGHDSHIQGVYRGLVILMGVYFFFLTERLMGIITTWRRRVHKKKSNLDSPKMYRTVEEHESEVGAKLSKHSDVVTSCEEIVMVVHPGKDVRHMAEDMHEELHRDCEPEEREQLNHSHGGHGHGHSHGQLPNGIAAVAWMVIMGDGLHNFSDGLAIGAAFASGLPGGLSTSVAVFCHELPHEIGDFAVLLRAGMSVKQAIVYNCVSSILCVFGMIVGVCVGNVGSVSLWIFALAGGMFIYIALVDMLPELTAVQPRKGENPLIHLALQNLGMITGAGIMTVIAIYEDDITLPSFEP